MIRCNSHKVFESRKRERMFMVIGLQDYTNRSAQRAVLAAWKITSLACSLQHCDGNQSIGAWIRKLSS